MSSCSFTIAGLGFAGVTLLTYSVHKLVLIQMEKAKLENQEPCRSGTLDERMQEHLILTCMGAGYVVLGVVCGIADCLRNRCKQCFCCGSKTQDVVGRNIRR